MPVAATAPVIVERGMAPPSAASGDESSPSARKASESSDFPVPQNAGSRYLTIRTIRRSGSMFQDTISLAAMADTLSLSPDYRVLRRLVPRLPCVPSVGQEARTAVLLDTETTGFDPRKDEIIELGMVKFDYLPDGRDGVKLGYLLMGAGFFHEAHRAVDDCHALLEILDFRLPATGRPALALLLDTARKPTVRIWAEQSPFELKDTLKRRGYRWSDGSDGRPRSWYVDVDETALDSELAFLKAEIYLRDVELPQRMLTAFNRFSART